MSSTADLARDLRAIEDMAARLSARAVDRATDREMPGGAAMVALAGVADPSLWNARFSYAEDHGGADELAITEDPDQMWPPLQTLRFWTEDWRTQLGMDYDDPRWRPTLLSETAFLRNPDVLNWAWDNEPHWDDFAADVARVVTQLENVLLEGERSERGVPCMYDNARLSRRVEPCRGAGGGKAWRWSDWHCPKCKRTWDADKYARMVARRHDSTHWWTDEDGALWCTVDRAARRVGQPQATIRTWVHRSQVASREVDPRLPKFVRLDDVEERHQLFSVRSNRALKARGKGTRDNRTTPV